jgi:transglutaminase-like putative cysteine protease
MFASAFLGFLLADVTLIFAARLARGATGRWYTIDARHNHPRIGRIVMGRGRDAADVAMSTAFGIARLARFEVGDPGAGSGWLITDAL